MNTRASAMQRKCVHMLPGLAAAQCVMMRVGWRMTEGCR